MRIRTSSCAYRRRARRSCGGRPRTRRRRRVRASLAAIDGDAGTVITHWDGNPASLDWVQYDVTSLPYRLRKGDVAHHRRRRRPRRADRDLGWQYRGSRESRSTRRSSGILERRYRDVTKIADHPGVTLVHDEARSYLTRAPAPLRRPADVADRHLGGHRRRRVHADGERPLHARRMAGVPARADADGRLQRVALVRSGRRFRDHAPAVAGRRRRSSTSAWPLRATTWCWSRGSASRR